MKIPRLMLPSLILAATLLGCGTVQAQEKTTPENLTLAAEARTLWGIAGKGDATALYKLRAHAKKFIGFAQFNLGTFYSGDNDYDYYGVGQGLAGLVVLGFLAMLGWMVMTVVDGIAMKWYRIAADRGDADGQFKLGGLYANERFGFKARDAVEAVKWYRKAADQGYASAQHDLGTMYFTVGGRGVAKDAVEAVKWFRKAADQGLADAQCTLGDMYATGRSVVKDEVKAYKWYLLARIHGNKQVEEKILRIEAGLTATQRTEWQRLAREWKPKK